MAKARKILNRLGAIRSVHTVTLAMETVASSRFRKVHRHAAAVRPYAMRLSALVEDMMRRCNRRQLRHALLQAPADVQCDALLLVTANRGLCGGYSQGVIRVALARRKQLLDAGREVHLHVVGKKGLQTLQSQGIEVQREHTQMTSLPDFAAVRELADEFLTGYQDGLIGGLEVAYMQFVSPGRQSPSIAPLLPLPDPGASPNEGADAPEPVRYDLLPSAHEILERLLPAMVRLRLYQCFLDAAVGEQIARITAMRAANSNADEMIHDLTRRYNRLRQGQITTELAEILGGRAS